MKSIQAISRIMAMAFVLACLFSFNISDAFGQSPTANEDSEQSSQTSLETSDDADAARNDTGDSGARIAVRALGDRDPQRRQTAAETLARIADNRQRRLVQGYRLQERDARVRLALDWALYRLGKPESLFAVVGALETNHREQAIEYLSRLDDPRTLLALLNSPKRQIKTGVLEAIGHVGNESTARDLQPFVATSDLAVAAAAQLAVTQIEARLSGRETATETTSRPRQVNRPATQTVPVETPADPDDPR